MRAIPWVLLAAVTAFAIWLWTSRPEPPPPAEVTAAKADIVPLRRCMARLSATEAVLERSRRLRAEPPVGPPPDVAQCVRTPAAAALIDTLVEEELERRVEELEAQRAETRASMATSADEFLMADLGLTTEQASWVKEYVCALRDQRTQLWRELESANEDRALVWEKLARERNEAIADLKVFLGDERYARLREVGGLGLIADAAGCK